MPIDVKILYKDGSTDWLYIPLNLMYGSKPANDFPQNPIVFEDWRWTHPTYELTLKKPLEQIVQIEIDPSQRMADVNRANNQKTF